RAALADAEMVIGPRKAYAVATVLGGLTAVAVLIGFAVSAVDRPRNQPVEAWYYVAAGASILVSGAAVTAMMLGWLRGGSAVLRVYLGRGLGDAPDVLANGDVGEDAAVPLATAQPNGWLRVRLTRLPFPPVCLGCGLVTRESIAQTLDSTNPVRVDLPLCQPCQADRRSRRRRAVLIGLAAGAAPGLLAVALAA